MRVVIFDLFLASCSFHTTPKPSTEAMLISGYHKTSGDSVALTDEPPDFALYDKVYIIKDKPELFHEPEWLTYSNVVLVGKYWEGVETEYNPEWDLALPDKYLYKGWADSWRKKYPSISDDRMESFYREPVKIKQGNDIVIPEGKNLLIIDNDMEEWDFNCEVLNSVPSTNIIMLHPFILTPNRWEHVLVCFGQRHIKRKVLWNEFTLNDYNSEDLTNAQNILNQYKAGRMFRVKMHVWADSHEEWEEQLVRSYNVLGDFRMNCGKRIWLEPHQIEKFSHPRILTELKRWTAMNQGYAKNSLFDYIVYDGCRDTEKMASFFYDPYEYLAKKRQGKNKLNPLVDFMETHPHLVDLITTSYPKPAYG